MKTDALSGMLLAGMILLSTSTVVAFEADSVQIHGFVSQGYLISDENDYFFADTEDGTFEFNEIGISFSSQLTDRLRLGVQFLSYDLGEFGDNEVDLDWAMGDYRVRNWLGFRAGKMKLAAGLFNKVWDIDIVRASIFLPTGIYDELFRDSYRTITGVAAYGTVFNQFDYEVQFGKIEIEDDGPIARIFASDIGVPVDLVDIDTDDDAVGFQLRWNTPLEGFLLGAMYLPGFSYETTAGPARVETEVDAFVLSAQYADDRISLTAEYGERGVESVLAGTTIQDVTIQAYYGMATYRFNPWLEVGAYYSEYYYDKDDRDGGLFEAQGLPRELAWLNDAALFARFDINFNWVMKAEVHHFDGLRTVESDDGMPDDNGLMFALKTTFVF